MTSQDKIGKLERMMKNNKRKRQKKTKIICPDCKSDNVETFGNYLAQKSIICKDCGYRGTQFLVEDKKRTKLKSKEK